MRAVSHFGHALHERPLYDVHSPGIARERLPQVFFEMLPVAAHQGLLQAFLHGARAPRAAARFRPLRLRSARLLEARRSLDEPLRSIGAAAEDNVFQQFQQPGRQLAVQYGGRRVHDAHVHPRFQRMVEENGVHGFAQVVVAAESEREVAHPSAYVGMGQMRAYPARGADEVERVAVVFRHSRSDGQHIRVENDVFRRETDVFRRKKPVGAAAHFDFPLVGVGLALLVEGHDHGGSAVAAYLFCFFEKGFFAFLERNGVDHGLSLHILQARADNAPVGTVDHEGHAGNVGLAREQAHEVFHLARRIEQSVVHVDIQDESPVFHLAAGYFERLAVVFLFYEAQELARAGHVAAFAYVDEANLGRYVQNLQPGEE